MTTITAKVIADSISSERVRLTTLQLRYPRFIHQEVMTHRQFSRNASSSRAIPVAKLIEDVRTDPAVPMFWGKNQKGMQAGEEHNQPIRMLTVGIDSFGMTGWDFFPCSRETAWLCARDRAVEAAKAFADAGYHKQVVNRLLEPFSHINVVVSATEWSNFFALRRHEDAEPHIHFLADRMYEALEGSTPDELAYGSWHVPYADDESVHLNPVRLSVARCARVSYLTHEGKKPNSVEDLGLYDRLIGSVPLHASPAEHQATPDRKINGEWERPDLHGNFVGWIQYRKTLLGECQ